MRTYSSAKGSLVDRLSLANVLDEAKVTARQVTNSKASPTTTKGYDTTGILIPPHQWPYYINLEPDMSKAMLSDFFQRVLPNHPLIHPQDLNHAKAAMRVYETVFAPSPISDEPSVWLSTHMILSACAKLAGAVGVSSEFTTEEEEMLTNVKIDSRILVKNGGGVAVEDESPEVYRIHCDDRNVEQVCDSVLVPERCEAGFRSILLKLSQYMIQKNIQWGFIHGGVHLRVVRVEYKCGRPFIIISGNIPVDSPAFGSMYTLICYMLLTAHEEELRIFGRARKFTPDPPSIMDTRNCHRPLTVPSIGRSIPKKISTIYFHTTAGGGSIPIDIVMRRKNSFQEKGVELDLEVTGFLGAGKFGRVYRCNAFIEDVFVGVLVVKLAHSKERPHFDEEESAYKVLHPLYDTIVPRFYGHFVGNLKGVRYSALLLGESGEPPTSLDDLSLPQRYDILMSLWRIHQAGVLHGDFHLGNILRSKDGIRIIDFSLAKLAHQCLGSNRCEELSQAADLLNLSPLARTSWFLRGWPERRQERRNFSVSCSATQWCTESPDSVLHRSTAYAHTPAQTEGSST